MRTFIIGLSALLCGLLLIGAVGLSAPVMQSQSYYINDHAGVIEQEVRDSMLQTAQKLYEETGVRVVLLTIENLDGRSTEEYAELVFRSWEIGTGAPGVLILLSTEEKRFAICSNTNVSDTHFIEAADKIAATEQFDLAAQECFQIVVDSIYSNPPTAENMEPEAAVTGTQNTQDTYITQITQNTEDTAEAKPLKGIFFMVMVLLFIVFFMRMGRNSVKRRVATDRSEVESLRRIYSPDEPIAVRIDDLDYPSGFGGLGNRKAIYLEDVDDADDIGIIKRESRDPSNTEKAIETYSNNTNHSGR